MRRDHIPTPSFVSPVVRCYVIIGHVAPAVLLITYQVFHLIPACADDIDPNVVNLLVGDRGELEMLYSANNTTTKFCSVESC